MSFDVHTLSLLNGSPSGLAQSDRLLLWQSYGIANAAGGSAGASVAVAVAVAGDPLPSSGEYFVEVELDQDATYYITGKSASGFTVNLQPRLASETLAAGAINVRVTA